MSNEMMTLQATKRPAGNKGAARRVRAEQRVPAIVYGRTFDNVPVSVHPRELELCLRTEYGFNVVLNLDIEGGETVQVMVKDYQFDGVRRELTHVDFIVLDDDETVVVPVPVEATGKSIGVVMGGRLDIVSRTVKLSCAVKHIPVAVVHDISAMNIADAVYIDEIEAPEGCTFVYDNRYPVIRIARKRGAKKDEEGGEGAAEGTDEEGTEGGEEGEEAEPAEA